MTTPPIMKHEYTKHLETHLDTCKSMPHPGYTVSSCVGGLFYAVEKVAYLEEQVRELRQKLWEIEHK